MKATFDGVPYSGSMVKYGAPQHMLGMLKSIREQIGKGPGDTVEVTIVKDETERTVEVPAEFEKLLKKEKVWARFRRDQLHPQTGIHPVDHGGEARRDPRQPDRESRRDAAQRRENTRQSGPVTMVLKGWTGPANLTQRAPFARLKDAAGRAIPFPRLIRLDGRVVSLTPLAAVARRRLRNRCFAPDSCPVPKWRNWQTRMVQVHVLARVWGFESLLRHQENSHLVLNLNVNLLK